MGDYSQELPQMSIEELRERTSKMVPCCVDESGMCFELEKGDAFTQSFIWKKKIARYLGQFSEHGIFVDDGTGEGTMKGIFDVYEYITMHKYAYLFKPSLAEVARFLPRALFDDHEKLYIVTKGIYRTDDSPFPICNGTLHLAKSFVCVETKGR